MKPDPGDPYHRQRSGTLKDILAASKKPLGSGKPLNGLDFPQSDLGQLPFISSDHVAWKKTQNLSGCKDAYPTTSLRWGLCATCGAYHREHFDAEGAGTFVSPICGVKIWLVGVPAAGYAWDAFADIDFVHGDLVKDKRIEWVALVLEPGTTL